MHKMLAQTLRLLLALSLAWLVLVGPAYLVAGSVAVMGLTAAVLLCLLPGVLVLLFQSGPLAAQQPVNSVLIGAGLRMAMVLASVLLVRELRPDLPATVFVVWLIPIYLVALAVETQLALSTVREQVPTKPQSAQLRASGTP